MTLEHMTFEELIDELSAANGWLHRALQEVEAATRLASKIGAVINERFPNG